MPRKTQKISKNTTLTAQLPGYFMMPRITVLNKITMAASSLPKILCLILLFIIIGLAGASSSLASTANLSWTAPTTNTDGSTLTDLAGYKVYYGTASGSYTSSIDVGNTLSYQVLSLTGGVTYYFAITAYDTSMNESAYSTEVIKTTGNDITPPVISGVASLNVTASSVTIDWFTDETADSQIEYGTSPAFGNLTTKDNQLLTSHSQTISGLSGPTTYYYRVLSADAAGNQQTSNTYNFTTLTPADTTAPIISNIQVQNSTASTIRIVWSTNEQSTSMVEYGMTAGYGFTTTTDNNLTGLHIVEIQGLAAATIYNFRVHSSDAAGNAAVSADNIFATSNASPIVSSLTATPSSGSAPLTSTLSAAASDQNGSIVQYEWDFDGDGNFDQNTGATSSVVYTYNTGGNFMPRVKVTDNDGATTISQPAAVTVSAAGNQPPTISSVTPSLSSGTAPMTTSINVSASDSDGYITQYEWDFDGNGTIDATTASQPVSHIFNETGDYTLFVRVTDNLGATAINQATVSVSSAVTPTPIIQAGTDGGGGGGGGGCFIATAAYGSYLDSHVMVLREFRDKYMLTNRLGTELVRLYYSTSPPIADYIARHGALKIATRLALTPIVYGVEYPYISFFLVFLIFASGIAAFYGYGKNRDTRKT